jgi:quaternary ammonium compound-resistance protein SugE
MAWIILFASAAAEVIMAICLKHSEGFTRLWWTIICLTVGTAGIWGLGWAMKSLPMGTSYVIWVLASASLILVYAVLTGNESLTPLKTALLIGAVICVAGLKAVSV